MINIFNVILKKLTLTKYKKITSLVPFFSKSQNKNYDDYIKTSYNTFVKYIKKFGFINNSNNKKNMIIKTFNKNLVEKNIFWAINRYLERI